ncbi:retrovirus-related pol polyprotein from transposon TNT 1-94 [Tanacetum coccineum]
MSGIVPPIPPPLGTNTGNTTSPNRVDTIPNDNTNKTTTNNVAQNVANKDLPQLLDSRGCSNVTNVPDFDKEDFSSWKDRFLVYLDGLEPYLLEVLENGPFVPMSSLSTSTNLLTKPQIQWSPEDRKLANQDKRLKTIIISCLPNDVMKSVIKCTTAKAMLTNLVLAHEGPFDTRDTKIAALRLKFNAFKALEGEKVNGTFTRLKCLLNDLKNNGVSIPQAKVNATFVNILPKKWLKIKKVPDKRSVFKAPKKKAQTVSPTLPNPIPVKKADSSTEQLLLTLMFRNHLLEDYYMKPKCSTCGSTYHMTKEHPKEVVVKKILAKLKAQLSRGSSSRKAPLILKPYIDCKYCSYNDHHSDECKYYPGCNIYGSIAHETADCAKKPSSKNIKPRIANRQSTKPTEKWVHKRNYFFFKIYVQDYLKRSVWYLDSVCSRHMTSVKQYMHRYLKESGPKVVFGDNSLGYIEGYGSVNCNGITFTKVAYVNGLKHNLIKISQLCDANFKVLFTKTQGTIFNQNNKGVLIAPRKRDVYVIDMSSYNEESNACFFAKASNSVNWLWHTRLSHFNFKNISKLARKNLVAGLPSLTFSNDKTCSACEKGKHHRASFKTKRSFFISECLHLLRMDLFGPVKPQTISNNKYTLVIVDEYSRVKEMRSDNGTEFRNHKLE